MDYARRRDRLRRRLRKERLDGLLVSDPTNVSYLTGFRGDDSYLLVGRDDEVLITDGRFTTQLAEECPDVRVHVRRVGTTMSAASAKVARSARMTTLGFEAHIVSVVAHAALDGALAKVELAATAGLVEGLREIKDKDEIAEIRRAVDQAHRAFGVVRASLLGEKTERQVAYQLESSLRDFGADGPSFPTIVAVGPRSALPHAIPGEHRLDTSGVLLVDWGADAGPYKSDLTRVLVTGKISPKLERVYRVVLKAQRRAIETVRAGVSARAVDRAARKVIDEAGFGRYFNHSVGHGLGMAVHESPRVAANVDQPLKAGMVLTVEPGIYLPGRFGVRIEDDVLVRRDGHEVLSKTPKDWDAIVTPG